MRLAERHARRKRLDAVFTKLAAQRTDVHNERSGENAFEGPPSAATALADSLGENARWSRIMVIGSKYPTVLAWSLSSCCSTWTVLPHVTLWSSFHPKRSYETKLSGSGRSLYRFLTIAWTRERNCSRIIDEMARLSLLRNCLSMHLSGSGRASDPPF